MKIIIIYPYLENEILSLVDGDELAFAAERKLGGHLVTGSVL